MTQCRGGPLADDRHYDPIIVGAEAGEETLARAALGKHVHLLERGDDLPGERDDWSSTAVFVHAIGADVLRPTAGRTAPDLPAIPGKRRTPVAAWADEGGRAAP